MIKFKVFWLALLVTAGLPQAQTEPVDAVSKVKVVYRVPSSDNILSEASVVKGNDMFIGGFDHVLRLSFTDGRVNSTLIDYKSLEDQLELCLMFLESARCKNKVRVLEFASATSLLFCGTNAGQSMCSYYDTESAEFELVDADAEDWLTSSNQQAVFLAQNSLSVHSLYIGATIGQMGNFRRRISTTKLDTSDGWFQVPEFKAIYDHSTEHIYVFYNEKLSYFSAEDFIGGDGDTNYYTLVGRVCKNDAGGTYFGTRWMTFARIRLLCARPRNGDDRDVTNLYYDELVSSYQIGSTVYTLSKPNRNWQLTNYAVSRYDLADIDAQLDGGGGSRTFVNSNDPDNDIVYSGPQLPFTPGDCPANTSYTMSNALESFVTSHSLVKAIVLPIDEAPFHVGDDDIDYKIVLAQELATATAVFLISEDGVMKKIIVDGDGAAVVIFQKRVINAGDPILSAKPVADDNFIVAVTQNYVITIPMSFCEEIPDCESCNADPHCRWVASANATGFHCEMGNSAEPNSCSSKPDPPTDIIIAPRGNSIAVLWKSGNSDTTSLYHIITLVFKNTDDVVMQVKAAANETSVEALIPRDELLQGRAYEVRIVAMRGNALSAQVVESFQMALPRPEVSIVPIHYFVGIEWSPVTGASSYKLQIVDTEMRKLEEVAFAAISSSRRYYHSNLKRHNFTAYVRASSADLVSSVAAVHFKSRDICSEWVLNSTVTSLPFDDSRPTGNESGMILNATESANPSTPVVHENCTLRLVAPGSMDLQNADSNEEETIHVALTTSLVWGIAILASLLLITLWVVVHTNFFVIGRKKTTLRDEDGFRYRRIFYVFWRKDNAKRRKAYTNREDRIARKARSSSKAQPSTSKIRRVEETEQ